MPDLGREQAAAENMMLVSPSNMLTNIGRDSYQRAFLNGLNSSNSYDVYKMINVLLGVNLEAVEELESNFRYYPDIYNLTIYEMGKRVYTTNVFGEVFQRTATIPQLVAKAVVQCMNSRDSHLMVYEFIRRNTDAIDYFEVGKLIILGVICNTNSRSRMSQDSKIALINFILGTIRSGNVIRGVLAAIRYAHAEPEMIKIMNAVISNSSSNNVVEAATETVRTSTF